MAVGPGTLCTGAIAIELNISKAPLSCRTNSPPGQHRRGVIDKSTTTDSQLATVCRSRYRRIAIRSQIAAAFAPLHEVTPLRQFA